MKKGRSGPRSITSLDDQMDSQDERFNIYPDISGDSPGICKQIRQVKVMRYYVKSCCHRIYYPVANPMAALMRKGCLEQ